MLADIATWEFFFFDLKHKNIINVSFILFRENQRPSDGKKIGEFFLCENCVRLLKNHPIRDTYNNRHFLKNYEESTGN